MKILTKSKIFSSVSSDGSVKFLMLPSYYSQNVLYLKNTDILNHAVWAGTRTKDQTEISVFIRRLNKGGQSK